MPGIPPDYQKEPSLAQRQSPESRGGKTLDHFPLTRFYGGEQDTCKAWAVWKDLRNPPRNGRSEPTGGVTKVENRVVVKDHFAWLSPVTFLQAIATQSMEIGSKYFEEPGKDQVRHIEQLGLGASGCFEEAYRKANAIEGPLDHETYADLIVEIKNRIGGNFSRATSEPGVVRVTSTRCPFGDGVKNTPSLCQMTSSVFGGIAARNFGFAKIVLHQRIACNDRTCEVSVVTDPAIADRYQGDEYHYQNGMIVGKVPFSGDQQVPAEADRERLVQGRRWAGRRRCFPPRVVAESEAMRTVLDMVEIVASTNATVLITGETGVGKEVVARRIHAMSGQRHKAFIAVNCGAIPENLVESALFGHERGAFTGAYEVHHGYFERAEGGTLFLDEIDSLPLATQVRLLRVLQEGEFERVGGKHTMSADVRVIAAGTEKLESQVQDGAFRRDLYYRLNVVPIFIPPLRDRTEDIPALIEHILRELSKQYASPVRALSPRALTQALSYRWPGNVREMENVLERSLLFSLGTIIEQLRFQNGNHTPHQDSPAASPLAACLRSARKEAADEVEIRLLRDTLTRSSGNITAAARLLHLTPRAIHKKLRAHQIDSGGSGARRPIPPDRHRRPETTGIRCRRGRRGPTGRENYDLCVPSVRSAKIQGDIDYCLKFQYVASQMLLRLTTSCSPSRSSSLV